MVVSKMGDTDFDIPVWEDECEDFPEHIELKERLRKTLYYGKAPNMDCPSLPMTELAVEYFQDAVPRELGKVDMYWASTVSRKASISPCAMMLAMLYIERLRSKDPDYLAKISSEDLFLIAMMLASKYLYDEGVQEEVYNDEWAESANLDLDEINEMERDFLTAIDWHLFVGAEEFELLLERVETQVALGHATHHGSLTYSEMLVLLHRPPHLQHNWHLLQEICKLLAVCSVAYTAGTMTMAASPTMHHLVYAELTSIQPATFDFTQISSLIQQCSQLMGGSGDQPANSLGDSNILAAELTGINVPAAELTDINVPAAELTGINVPAAELTGINVPAAELTDINVPAAELTGINVPAAELTGINVPAAAPQLKPRCRKRCRHVSSTSFLSQFLTLTLFKDTLITLVVGMKDDPDMDSTQEPPTSICHCPVCPLRRNKTSHQTNFQLNQPKADYKLENKLSKMYVRPQVLRREYDGGSDSGGGADDATDNLEEAVSWCASPRSSNIWHRVVHRPHMLPHNSLTI